MALTLDGTTQSQINQAVLGVHWLIEADFTGGTVRLTTAPIDVTSGGSTYTGLGQLMTVSDVSESGDVAATKVTIGFSIANTSGSSGMNNLLGSIETYRGKAVRLYLQVFDERFVPVGTKTLRWSGYMNPISVKPQRNNDGTMGAEVEMPCSRAGMNRFRNFQGLRLTHEQHIVRFPGDLGLQYMAELIQKPTVWLSKRFQEV